MNKFKLNLIAILIGVIYFIASSLPIISLLFTKNKKLVGNSSVSDSQWVEEPMMVEV